jgi:hypothetical protein
MNCFPELRELDLTGNRGLDYVPPGAFASCPGLVTLQLSGVFGLIILHFFNPVILHKNKKPWHALWTYATHSLDEKHAFLLDLPGNVITFLL